MFETVLVPLDGSKLAERALVPAIQLVKANKGDLLIVRVPTQMPLAPPAQGFIGAELLWTEQAEDIGHTEAATYLDSIRSEVESQGVAVRTELIGGDPASVIAGVADQRAVDLIVMCTHGRSGFSRWVLGSVTEKVLRMAPAPVMVVRSPGPYQHLLIPLDGSRLSERALAPALAFAARMSSKVTLLYATGTHEIEDADYWQLGSDVRGDTKAAHVDRARAYLERVAEYHARPGLDLKFVLRKERPADAIVDFAQSHQVDMVAMATHGRSGLQHMVYGSVTEKVLRSGKFTMLIVPSADRARHLPALEEVSEKQLS
ncbi:MAG: universal stress protein [Anaerolineales bacterium]|nr:universal stress protein [Anaerolineales bacterium]